MQFSFKQTIQEYLANKVRHSHFSDKLKEDMKSLPRQWTSANHLESSHQLGLSYVAGEKFEKGCVTIFMQVIELA
jgi:hypothetical protein